MKKENLKKEILESKEKVKIDQCLSAPHPEMARNTDADEPCDDNRA